MPLIGCGKIIKNEEVYLAELKALTKTAPCDKL